MDEHVASATNKPASRSPWNNGKLVGAKPPLRPEPRLVIQDQAPDRGAQMRPRAVQPRDRQ
jgi:hypothetical protein